jgi:dTDP-4-amino-4,6-dideoxygalactose transaminase
VTHNIDPAKIEALITPRTTAIMGVHLWGRGCDVDAIQEIADRRGLHLLFDASHAFGCSHRGKMIGGFGRAEVFSFHATKFINTLEGGAVTTNDDALALKLRRMKNFGFSGYDQVDSIGINGKMNEVSAAMGLTNLESLDQFVQINRDNYEQYQHELNSIPGITLLRYDQTQHCNYQYIVVELDAKIVGLTRDALVEHLHRCNIIARRYFYPGCHGMEPYRSLSPNVAKHLPETERLKERLFCLPTGSSISREIISDVCRVIRDRLQSR